MNLNLKKLGNVMRLEHFATTLASFFLCVIFILAVQFGTGIYLPSLRFPLSGLLSLAILVFFTILSSRLVFHFTKKDGIGLALTLPILLGALMLWLYLLSVSQGKEFIFWKTLLQSGYYATILPLISVAAITLIYYALLWFFLDEKKK